MNDLHHAHVLAQALDHHDLGTDVHVADLAGNHYGAAICVDPHTVVMAAWCACPDDGGWACWVTDTDGERIDLDDVPHLTTAVANIGDGDLADLADGYDAWLTGDHRDPNGAAAPIALLARLLAGPVD